MPLCGGRDSTPALFLPTCRPPREQLAEMEALEVRYRALVEQNRALYNEVQDLKGSIRVFCRVR